MKRLVPSSLSLVSVFHFACVVSEPDGDSMSQRAATAAPSFDPDPVDALPETSAHISGRSRQVELAGDGSVVTTNDRFNLSNRIDAIALGAIEGELVLYSRLDETLERGRVHPGGGWQPLETVVDVAGQWDAVVRGDFDNSVEGAELGLYDRASGVFSIRSLESGMEELSSLDIGTTWTGLTSGHWSFWPGDELALYDHARGVVRIVRPGLGSFPVATFDAPRNMEHFVAARLDGPAHPPSLVFHNTDIPDTKYGDNARVVDLSATYSPSDRQTMKWPGGEAVSVVAGEFGGSVAEDIAIYDAATGETELWLTGAGGELAWSKALSWGEDWTHVAVLPMPSAERSDVYLYSNMVTVLVDFMRVNDDDGSKDLNFTAAAAVDERGPARMVAWLNQTFRPAGLRFDIGEVHDVFRDEMVYKPDGTVRPLCSGGPPMALGKRYGHWLGQSACVECVGAQAPGCAWGTPGMGPSSCDAVATSTCAEACPVADWSICTKTEAGGPGGCFSDSVGEPYVDYCETACPSPESDRLVMAVFPQSGTKSCVPLGSPLVFLGRKAPNKQYFAAHEVGHLLGLNHTHRNSPPFSDDPWDYITGNNPDWHRVEEPDDLAGMFNNRYFGWLDASGEHCDESVGIDIPDSGSCLSAHGANGCTKVACRSCVDAIRDTCFKAGGTGPQGSWDTQCVAIAGSTCANVCETTTTHYFEPPRHNVMSYGSEMCSNVNEIFRLTPSQLRRTRENILVHRPGLVVPSPVFPALCPPLSCLSPAVGLDSDWDGCVDSCECPSLSCGPGETGEDTNGDGCVNTCLVCTPVSCGVGFSPVDADGDGCPDECQFGFPFP